MRELTLDEIKQIGLEMFICFDKVCRENNIKYSIAYGTLIGAIRHKGFIPWDDDVDIIMCRDEYEKFLSVWKDGKFKLMTLQKGSAFWPMLSRITDPRTYLVPPKICNHGVWLAVIPYDKVPDDPIEYKKHMDRITRYMQILELKRAKIRIGGEGSVIKHLVKKALQIALKPISPYTIGKHVEKLKTKYRNCNCKRVKPWDNTSKILVDSNIFDDYVDVEFEGVKAMATARYDYILRYEYGDYMKLPPEEERIPKHGFKAFINE